jgi:hypothetical protein
MPERIIVDIWTGENSLYHCARFIRCFDDAIEIARIELHAGNLVNLRSEADFGDYQDFDERTRYAPS